MPTLPTFHVTTHCDACHKEHQYCACDYYDATMARGDRLEATIKASVAVLKEISPGNAEGYNTAMVAAALTLLDGALR